MTARLSLCIVVSTLLLASTGCGTSSWSRWKQMAPSSIDVTNRFTGAVSVDIKADKIWRGKSKAFIKGEGVTEHLDEFRKAIADTITKHQLFTSVAPQGQADFMLVCEITDASDASGMREATLDTTWTLWTRSAQKLWEKSLKGSSVGPRREGEPREPSVRSARSAIKLGLESLSQSLRQPPPAGAPR